MRFPNLLTLISACCLVQHGKAEDPFQALVRPTEALSAQDEQKKLRVPEGFSVQLFASEPMINKPINIAFDERGRLWVTSNTEYPFPAEKNRRLDPEGSRVKDSRDAIKILEDTNGDGTADKVTDFADQLNIPIGVLPYGKGCIAWSIPNIWYFADNNGDGVCDERKILFGPLGYEKDTHGNIASLRLGRDGWVYATHGFSNTSKFIVRPENLHGRKVGDPGTTLELQSGNVFRFKPDGSAVELWSRGQVNPFGLCWDAWGNLYSADCHSNPLTQLIYQATYPSFGKPDDGLGFGPVLCPHSHGSTGLCGVLYLEGDQWGGDWNDHMLLGNCVTSRINRDKIVYTGATPRAVEQPDFLTSEDPWFRPVDLKMGPDHALYVADFYNCIIGHYEVDRNHPRRDRERGRIWRISKSGAKAPESPTAAQRVAQEWRWTKANLAKWSEAEMAEATSILNDQASAPQLRRIVAEAVISHPSATVVPSLLAVLKQTDPADVSLRHTLRLALRNSLAQANAFASLPDKGSDAEEISRMVGGLTSAEASGWQLAYLSKSSPDRETLAKALPGLVKNLTDDAQATLVKLVQERFREDEATQLALLKPLVRSIADRGSQPVPEVRAWAEALLQRWVTKLTKSSNPAWEGDFATFGRDTRPCVDGVEMQVITSLPPPRSQEIEVKTGKLRSHSFALPEKLSFWLCGHNGFPANPAQQRNFVRLITDAGEEIQRAYPPRNDTAQRIEWVGGNHVGKMVRLEIVDGDTDKAYAWLAVGRFEPQVVPVELPQDVNHWQTIAEITSSLRMESLADALAASFMRSELNDGARSVIAKTLLLFPAKQHLLIDLFKTASNRQQSVLGEVLASTREGVDQLCQHAPARLLTQPNIATKIASWKDAALNERVAKLTKDLPPLRAETDALLAARLKGFQQASAAGTVRMDLGRQLFQTHCANCHQIGGKGAVIGPQLDGTKNRGAERLCEDIIDPNRAVDPVFHLHILKLKNNTMVAGLQRRDQGATVVIADAAGQEHTVLKSDIAENNESPLSLMPAGFGEALPEADFYHLLGYLLTQ